MSSAEGADLVGCKNPGIYAGISFAYVWPGEDRARDYRFRRDSPEVEYKSDGSTKEKRNYLCAPGGRNRLYFPFGIEPQTLEDVIDSFFTESCKAILAI